MSLSFSKQQVAAIMTKCAFHVVASAISHELWLQKPAVWLCDFGFYLNHPLHHLLWLEFTLYALLPNDCQDKSVMWPYRSIYCHGYPYVGTLDRVRFNTQEAFI